MTCPNSNANPQTPHAPDRARRALADAWCYPAAMPTIRQARIDRACLHALADALTGADLAAVVALADILAHAAPPDDDTLDYAAASATLARAYGGAA